MENEGGEFPESGKALRAKSLRMGFLELGVGALELGVALAKIVDEGLIRVADIYDMPVITDRAMDARSRMSRRKSSR